MSVPAAFSQDVSTQGTEFWVSFMSNGYKVHIDEIWLRIQLLISAKNACSCTIANPRTGWQQSFDIEANGTYLYDNIDEQQAYIEMTEAEMVLDKGLLITSTDTVSVYCSNIAIYSFDVSYVMPTESLADDYIIQTYDQSNNYNFETSAFLIVATEDNTTVDITPACATLRGRPAGETFTITMNRGQSYQVRSTNTSYESRDLSGSRVTARDCKKIAVFNGNNLTTVPFTYDFDADCVFEQAMPVRSWGKRFIVTSSLGRNQDYVKITSSTNDNEILKNGQHLCTLNANQSYTFPLSSNDKSCYLEANGSCAVYLYNTSAPNHGTGAPSMIWIAPLEQRIDEITFSTFNYDHPYANINMHYANIIVHKDDVGHVYLDGELLPVSLFEDVTGNDDYCFFRNSIEHGVHHLTCEKGLNAHVYGFGEARGYAYMVGSRAKDLSTSLTINDLTIQSNDDFQYCVEEPITFEAEVNYQNYRLLWDFGDGTTSTENPVAHTYHDKDIYAASLIVSVDEINCQSTAIDTTLFYINTTQQYIIESDEICADALYTGHGFNNVLINNDTILARIQDNVSFPECKDSLLVYIAAHPNYHTLINDSRCWHGTADIYRDHGFNVEYNQPGEYDRQLNLTSTNGCDSIVTLHLTVTDQIAHEFEHYECSSSYVWDGTTYYETGIYEKTYLSSEGCDSIVTLHLTLKQPQHTSFDTITCGIFHWNGQDYTTSGTYQQTFTTYDGCDSIVDCTLIISGSMEGSTVSIDECDSYYWIDSTYTISGNYEKVISSTLGCDSTIHLNLNLQYTPNPTEIHSVDTTNHSPHWVITATEFQINAYEFKIEDYNSVCQWDSITWQFEEPSVQWRLEPDTSTMPAGKRCKMSVVNYIEDTIWLHTTIYNRCAPQGISQRYWFVCSFYGMDEFGTSTASGTAKLEVAPNPNEGQMTLHFENLTGKVDMKVYDMTGNLIDHFETYSDIAHNALTYNLKGCSDGIYFFVATAKEGMVAKKVVIKR